MRSFRASIATALTVVLTSTLLNAPPTGAQQAAQVTTVQADRRHAVDLMKSGGPNVSKGAEAALLGSAEDVRHFLDLGLPVATTEDLRLKAEQVLAVGGRLVRTAAQQALAGSGGDVRRFLDNGWQGPYQRDLELQVAQIMAVGGPQVKAAAQKALGTGGQQALLDFVQRDRYTAKDSDDRLKTSQLMAAGGSEVKKAAQRALDGTIEDVREFLRLGYQIAADRDQETSSVAQLADLAKEASARAQTETDGAKEASDRAVEAARLAKEATVRAASEAQLAKDSSIRAGNAANRAADAASTPAALRDLVSDMLIL